VECSCLPASMVLCFCTGESHFGVCACLSVYVWGNCRQKGIPSPAAVLTKGLKPPSGGIHFLCVSVEVYIIHYLKKSLTLVCCFPACLLFCFCNFTGILVMFVTVLPTSVRNSTECSFICLWYPETPHVILLCVGTLKDVGFFAPLAPW